ncbi:50S ribosomal protein L1 [Phanerochaete sordida]|uniref:50S ribosomal protein L1 n=1 Tax=Phanerochaete sordida TaxID=48140 RepID=A0A9P3G221_9APHY|nr:50S ribosomal protein L1 [Phanerochaete sordida]
MSLANLAFQCRAWTGAVGLMNGRREFHAAAVLMARKQKERAPLTKAQLAAKARKRALKAKKNVYDVEKMPLNDAISVLRAVEVASPNATYELVIKTQAPERGATIPKGRYSLPREPKPKAKDRILVFAEGRAAEEAKKAGADIVGGVELVEGIISGRHQATMYLCSPDLIRAITPRLGRVLGPLGLMPSERRGTVTDDVAGYIRRLQGTNEWKGDKVGAIRTAIAKMNWPLEDVIKNIRYFLTVVKRATGNERSSLAAKEEGSNKPQYQIVRVVLSSPHGPGIRIADY